MLDDIGRMLLSRMTAIVNCFALHFPVLNHEELCRFYLGGAEQRGETMKWTGSIADANIFLEASCWDLSDSDRCWLLINDFFWRHQIVFPPYVDARGSTQTHT